MRNSFKYLLICSLVLKTSGVSHAQITFPKGSSFKYLKGNSAESLPGNWYAKSFNDAVWASGNSPFRYGDGSTGTELTDMMNTYSTVYLRSHFTVANAQLINNLSVSVNYDDGFAMFINGYLVLQQNAPEAMSFDALAPANHESGIFEDFNINALDAHLTEGDNVLAIQAFNVALTSTDFYLDASIAATTESPVLDDSIQVAYSFKSGFYDNAFNLVLTSPDPTAKIVYTLDGSNPQDVSFSMAKTSPYTVRIDPSSTSGRDATPAVTVRASLVKSGYTPTFASSRTFIFPAKVKVQTNPGGSWPQSDINGQKLYMEVDTRVSNSTAYSNDFTKALKDIPTISLITNIDNLFDPATGIYVNAYGHGLDWERECSVELITNDGSEGFNTNAGLRIRGGWSRHNEFPKHGFRLFFRKDYGDADLDYPLFGRDGADEFEKIDLRCEQNYAWSNGDSRNSLVREVFSRDTQRDMERPYSRSNSYHLYLNGMYWGIYQFQERTEAAYAASYFGGSANDYDVIKVNTENWNYQVEATDGTTASWLNIYNLANKGFTTNTQYFALEGKDKDGKVIPDAKVLVDIDNLIDYMLTIFYTGNFDAPTSQFGNNKMPNNFFAIYNREDPSQGYKFFNHDGEHAMMVDQASPGIGINENRVDLGARTEWDAMEVNGFYNFHPQWLHYKLSANAEYRLRFADRAYKALTNGGVFTEVVAEERMNVRADEIEWAVINESARWGAANSGTPYTKNTNWLPVVNQLRNSFFPDRADIVIDQLQDEDLMTALNPPVILKEGNSIETPSIAIQTGVNFKFDNPNSGGKIYYTLNNTDPRSIGGEVSGSALEIDESKNISFSTSGVIKSRIFNNNKWSALRELYVFSENEDLSKFVITELNYHPKEQIVDEDTLSDKSLEFIEFKNIGTSTLNISGITIDSSITYTIPQNTLLDPGKFYVVSASPSKFYQYFNLIASGNYSGNFSNSGEQVLVKDAQGSTLMNFAYQQGYPWPVEADGYGKSMVPVDPNPTGNPTNFEYWKASVHLNGSPFHDDGVYSTIEEPLASKPTGALLAVYPNPTADNLIIDYPGFDGQAVQIAIRLVDLNGRLIYKTEADNTIVIDLISLNIPAGLYFLQITAEDTVETMPVVYKR